MPDHAADPLTAKPHAQQHTRLCGLAVFFINEVIECLAEVERLHIQHDLRYGMLLGRRMLRRRTFTPLAGEPAPQASTVLRLK